MRRLRVRSIMTHRTCRVLLCALLWAAVPSVFFGQQVPRPPDAKPPSAQPPPGGDEPATTFKVNVKLVNVFTTVTDQSGAPVGGLTKDDFHIFEDGKEQSIAALSPAKAICRSQLFWPLTPV